MVGFNGVLFVALGFLGLPSLWAPGPAANGQGNKAFEKHQYDQALQHYQKAQQELPAEKILALNSGTALLGAGKNQEALSSLMSASADPRRGVQSRALYNAGNALSDGKQLEESLDAYRRAILADPKNEDAKFNYELTKRRLQEQQKQDKKKQDKDDKDKKDDKGKQDQDPKDQDKKDQQQKDQDKKDQEQKNPPDKPPEDPKNPQDQPPQEPPPGMMSQQEAERLLDALKDNEIKQLKEKLTSKRRKNVDKDW